MIKLRQMVQQDVESVHGIELTTSEDPWTFKIFSDCLVVGYKCFVFEETDLGQNKRIIGYGLLSVDKKKKEAHVLNVTIIPERRRLGLGMKMMYNLLRIARKNFVKQVKLEVKVSNKSAINMYNKLNFKQTGLKEGYYPLLDGTHEDALVFALELKKGRNIF